MSTLKNINYQNPKFKIGDIVTITKYKNFCNRLCSKLV